MIFLVVNRQRLREARGMRPGPEEPLRLGIETSIPMAQTHRQVGVSIVMGNQPIAVAGWLICYILEIGKSQLFKSDTDMG